MTIRSYHHLKQLKTFVERYEYLKLKGIVGEQTFGRDRYVNQVFYRSPRWRSVRNEVIIRDNGCDLGVEGYEIVGHKILIHHINPVTLEQIEEEDTSIFDPEYLICVSFDTHNAIHFGDASLLPQSPIERRPWDTCPWRYKNFKEGEYLR